MKKFMRWLLPVIAGISIVGTGFSVFYFTPSIIGTSSEVNPQLQLEQIAESGTISVKPMVLNAQGAYEDFAVGKTPLLVISQRTVSFEFEIFDISYISGSNINHPVTVAFSATMELGESADSYLDVVDWKYDESENLYRLDDFASVIATEPNQGFEDEIRVAPPKFIFSDGRTLITTEDVEVMTETLEKETIKFSFSATVSNSEEEGGDGQ